MKIRFAIAALVRIVGEWVRLVVFFVFAWPFSFSLWGVFGALQGAEEIVALRLRNTQRKNYRIFRMLCRLVSLSKLGIVSKDWGAECGEFASRIGEPREKAEDSIVLRKKRLFRFARSNKIRRCGLRRCLRQRLRTRNWSLKGDSDSFPNAKRAAVRRKSL